MVRRLKLRGNPSTRTHEAIATLIAEGIALHQSGNLDGAEASYLRVLAQDPNQADALHFLGLLEHQRGRCERALELMNRSLERFPEHTDFLSNRGNVLRHLGLLDQAEADYARVLKLEPKHANALNNLGTIWRERGNYDLAIAHFRRAITANPAHADAYQNLGNALEALNQLEPALEAHREALRLRSDHGDSYRHLAGMFYALGRIDEAAELYRQWLRVEPNHPIATHMLAACTGIDVPARASNEFVRTSFDDFAVTFDRTLQRLEYRAPVLVGETTIDFARCAGDQKLSEVLDLGCGTGLVATMIRPYVKRLVGVDLSPKMIERARARGLYDELYVEELVAFCSSTGERFELIVSADTLVYFGVLDAAVSAMARCLRPGGTLVFTSERCEDPSVTPGYRIHPHGRYSHTEAYLGSVLALAGLEPTRVQAVELRKEAGKWVDGWLVVARLPAAQNPTQ